MSRKNIFKYLVIVGIVVLAGFALADSLGYFNPKPYTGVSHGSHVHYVPENRDPDVPIGDFPTEEPGPNEKITPQGKVVRR